MKTNKDLITLAAICWNEEDKIDRFIRSFSKVADSIVLTRAIGNLEPDGTLEIAAKVCSEIGVRLLTSTYHNKLDALDIPHTDSFADARQMAWDHAATLGGKFLMWADIDDTISDESAAEIRKICEETDKDVVIVPYHVQGSKQIVLRERIVRNRDLTNHPSQDGLKLSGKGIARWRYRIHEQLQFLEPVSYTVAKNAHILHEPSPGRTSSHPRNMTLLKLETENSARNLFYLHQECWQTQQVKLCQRYGAQALLDPSLEIVERYEILLNLAQLENGPKAKEYAAQAFEIMPDRREALALLCNYAIIDKQYEKALALAEIILWTPKPKKAYWTLNNDWYDWKANELHDQCQRLVHGKCDFDVDSIGYKKFSIIHATMGRPQKALMIREMWLSRADDPSIVDYVFGLHEDDKQSIEILKGFRHTICGAGVGCPTNYDTAAGIATGEILIQGQDDCYPPQGWDTMMLEAINGYEDKPFFLACSDGFRTDKLCASGVMNRKLMDLIAADEREKALWICNGCGCKFSYVESASVDVGPHSDERCVACPACYHNIVDEGLGALTRPTDQPANGFMHRGYRNLYADTDNTQRAYKWAQDGKSLVIEAKHIVLYHDHPLWNPQVPWDATYAAENEKSGADFGAKLFLDRWPTAQTDGILTL